MDNREPRGSDIATGMAHIVAIIISVSFVLCVICALIWALNK